jgi:hypothetical protein
MKKLDFFKVLLAVSYIKFNKSPRKEIRLHIFAF